MKPLMRHLTLERNLSGRDVSGVTVCFRKGSATSLQKLHEIALSSSSAAGEGLLIPADHLAQVRVLGEGAFGVVWQCAYAPPPGSPAAVHVEDGGGYVAVKRLKLPGAAAAAAFGGGSGAASGEDEAPSSGALAMFMSELLTLRAIRHPNVIAYIGCTLYSHEGIDQLALVQEYAMHGTLKELINDHSVLRKRFSVEDGLRWAHHVALGMAFLHDCKPIVMHRDLKPENILLCGPRATAKICDFGLVAYEERRTERRMSFRGGIAQATSPDVSPERAPYRMTGQVGSLRYMGPENFRGDAYDHRTDVYSFAIIMYELLSRRRAYEELLLTAERIAMEAANSGLRPQLPTRWPEEVAALQARVWHSEPAQRPPFREIVGTLARWRRPEGEPVVRELVAASPRGLLHSLGCGPDVSFLARASSSGTKTASSRQKGMATVQPGPGADINLHGALPVEDVREVDERDLDCITPPSELRTPQRSRVEAPQIRPDEL